MKLNKSLIIVAMAIFAASGLFAKEQTKKTDVPGVAPQPSEFFYTGKPYDADLGAYTFNYRNYDPELKRWTSMDPSGFPNGTNNLIYVKNFVISCIDRLGLDIYQITNSTAVGNAGHSAMIANYGNTYVYQSYGSVEEGSSTSPTGYGLTSRSFDSLSEAMGYANSKGYDNYCGWEAGDQNSALALSSMEKYVNDGNEYNPSYHNCQDAVNAGLDAANVAHYDSNIPNVAMNNNSSMTNISGKVKSLE